MNTVINLITISLKSTPTHWTNILHPKRNSFAPSTKLYFSLPNVILPVFPPSIFLIWFRTRIIGNNAFVSYKWFYLNNCLTLYLSMKCLFLLYIYIYIPPLWSSGQSFWLQIQRSRVRSPALPDFLSSSRSGTGSTQPREVNWGATWI